MTAEIIASTPDATKVVARAAWVCTHAGWPTDHDMHPDRSGPLVRRVLASGHTSVLEHASFTFAIDGISRACSHQLVRHRQASYSQQSQRYVHNEEPDYVVPSRIKELGQEDRFKQAMENAWAMYRALEIAGVHQEDARLVLPNAASTRLVVTMNARALHHFFSLRCCRRAQWEIRDLANEMLRQCRRVAPVLFETAGPGCARGPCPEGAKSCGGML